MATTTPDGIYYPTSTTQISPLETQFSTLATSVQTALTNRKTITVANAAALDALSEATYSGWLAYVSGTGSSWYSNGTKWLLASIPVVASAAARDALYTGSVTVTQGDSVFRNDLGYQETYFGLYNVSTNPGGKTTAGWYPASGITPSFVTTTARTSAIATPYQGLNSYISGTNSYWTYYEAYNASTNPGGAAVAGWYPMEGTVLFAGKRTTNQSFANATYTSVAFNSFTCAGSTSNTTTIQIDSATTPANFTVRNAGWYQLSGVTYTGSFSSTAGTQRNFHINRNSTTGTTNVLVADIVLIGSNAAAGTLGSWYLKPNAPVLLAANDVIRFLLYQDSGGAANNGDINASITYLRPASV